MENLKFQEPKLKLPGIRPLLIKIHKDLFLIDKFILRYSEFYPEDLSVLEKLVLVLEDRRFLDHRGIDLKSIIREILKMMTFRRHGGASTIDMQFVRTVTGYRHLSLRRKLYEIFLSVLIQFRYNKITILRSYLACAFFGSHLIGVNKATNKVFNQNPEDLSIDEAAFIAAMLVYPRPMSPSLEWQRMVQRRANYGKRIYISNKQRFEKLPR